MTEKKQKNEASRVNNEEIFYESRLFIVQMWKIMRKENVEKFVLVFFASYFSN